MLTLPRTLKVFVSLYLSWLLLTLFTNSFRFEDILVNMSDEDWDRFQLLAVLPPIFAIVTYGLFRWCSSPETERLSQRLISILKARPKGEKITPEPYRKDLNLDFPLRGFVLCPKCHDPMTASWSTSRTGVKHPYYHCKKKGCELYSKSRARDLVHGEMQGLLETMRPAEATVELLRQIVEDVWVSKKQEHKRLLSAKKNDLEKIEEEITLLMDKCLRTKDEDLSEMYEGHLKTLKLKKEALKDVTEQLSSVDTSLEDALGTITEFISNPAAMWESGDFEEQRLVLKLAFAERLPFDKDKGFGTAGKSLPFRVLEGLRPVKSKMVVYSG